MTSMIVLMFCAVTRVATTQESLANDAVSLAVKLHSLNWTRLSADDVARSFPTFERIGSEMPEGSQYRMGPCSGSVYLHSHSSGDTWLEFEMIKGGGGDCSTMLRAISAEIRTDRHTAEVLRLKTISELHATGPISLEMNEYQWRSTDSRTKNVLTVRVDHEARGGAIVLFKLRHITVAPEMVDGLPFEKGFYPPLCARNDEGH